MVDSTGIIEIVTFAGLIKIQNHTLTSGLDDSDPAFLWG